MLSHSSKGKDQIKKREQRQDQCDKTNGIKEDSVNRPIQLKTNPEGKKKYIDATGMEMM